MAELPASWGLRRKRRADGKLDLIGKTDAGEEYRVRTCDSGSVTDHDLVELKAADRESYASRDAGARAFVSSLVASGRKDREAQENEFLSDLEEAAGPVVHAGFERSGSTVGSSRAYRQNYDAVFGRTGRHGRSGGDC